MSIIDVVLLLVVFSHAHKVTTKDQRQTVCVIRHYAEWVAVLVSQIY
jgi:hypothetical protein